MCNVRTLPDEGMNQHKETKWQCIASEKKKKTGIVYIWTTAMTLFEMLSTEGWRDIACYIF